MESADLAPMVVAVVLILTTGGVLVLRPLVKRLGAYLEQATLEKLRGANAQQAVSNERVVQLLESVDSRLTRLEERVHFTESLLAKREPQALPPER